MAMLGIFLSARLVMIKSQVKRICPFQQVHGKPYLTQSKLAGLCKLLRKLQDISATLSANSEFTDIQHAH